MALLSVNTKAQPLSTFRAPPRDLDVDHLRVWVPGTAANRTHTDLKRLTTDAELVMTIEGASTLTLKVRDYDRKLLNSPLTQERSTLSLDYIEYSLAKVSHDGDEITLIFEETAVNLLRRYDSPKKASRDSVTRAQFIRGMIMEVKERKIPFHCPELTQRQPIAGG